ncbi:putative S-adenosyl-L-methionine-dependent protein-arginine N- methyltransferase that methylates the delta-nitrogen atom of arginine residues to form N5-methylarginine (type IV) in target proteins [Lyophyllum shimeji]|uniref:S-adenosyl-L-methionine-dependent protein-arginine N- methyltransferase that methylates the delta-nitrogen atom of arginine residues to form N5-methylarginine (Type IV) in target proteins n=1 Tax=Lyophyllum shimeji TaxID=47721 RepID=A0A9P3PJP4_LYOSH|nr:putative S-adenosyl-L-methionine-dependent protein-arginine N- methyltransferase that methylates the delta-nitrogen atom of arginine residues to form N5-methylarginine (type IV) in target proteins [Lyophyllum shimeji]
MAETSDLVNIDVEIQALSRLGERLIDSIIADEPLEAIEALINSDAPLWYQNEAEGISPLHAAAYMQNTELVRVLIERGAVWNAVDNLKNTAGDIALSFNDLETYMVIRDAGIRAELLLSLLSSKASIQSSSSVVLREIDSSAAGSTEAFLSSNLKFIKDAYGQDICVLKIGDEEVGVMMGWEQGIMEDTVRRLCDGHPNAQKLKILNIGFGLGIIDSLFQALATRPAEHVIIEPHADVLQYIKERGWYDKPGVRILEGKWQDVLDSDAIVGVGGFDVIYTDTFSEDYGELRQFFERLPDLLAGPESRFSFFNGLGATNALFYDVYMRIAELHLADVGIDTQCLYIYDRHCTCVYYQDWHRTRRPKPAVEGGILPAVSQAVAPPSNVVTGHGSGFTSPRDTLSSGTGIVVAVNDMAQSPVTPLLQTPAPPVALSSTGLGFDEEAKLVYGVILSLRNMVKKLSGRDEQFVNYRTSTYKLHVYETPSGYKFVMFSDPNTDSLRFVLRQVYVGPFLEYVVRNPLVKMDSREYGIDNEYFRASVDRLVRGLSVFP